MKIALGLVFGFALGLLTYFVLFGRTTTKHHWKIVEKYIAYGTDSANYKPDAATGLSVATPPVDPAPSLAALVAAGELNYVDLVLPTAPHSREATQYWMKFSQTHKEIVYMTGNPSFTAFPLAGTQPLHLNIWFRASDAPVVQTLVRELEGTYAK
ncbi:MAG: hypothetical protein K9N23_17675 [Akkermansiaceae bacterium]|nr:hypothetical protein [Akkermansiaceae bacterium]MCF7733523.1 hypothetical protein [Akkermansiaceae bacterium]